jgi:hypothetical protein
METVSFYSYKGGVGRTLLVANTAQFLALSGRRVVALDLDLEAPGLHHKLGSADVLARAKSGTLRGVVDELLERLSNGAEPPEASALGASSADGEASGGRIRNLLRTAVMVDLPSGTGSLSLIPAGAAPSQGYWARLEQLNNVLRTNRANGGLAEALLDLQASIIEEFNPEFLLVDSRTGITELGGLATSILADRVVCMTTTAPESIEGIRVVAEALRSAPRLASQPPLRIDFLMTRVASESPASLAQLKQQWGEALSILPHDAAIADQERLLSGAVAPAPSQSANYGVPGGFFTRMLDWIGRSFPGQKELARRAQRRLVTLSSALLHLSRSPEPGLRGAEPWPLDQLRERVRFGTGDRSRLADIVVYDLPADSAKAKPLMVVQFIGDEDPKMAATWWFEETRVPVFAVIPDDMKTRLYSRARMQRPDHYRERWDLPLPHDFNALRDPTDGSAESFLEAFKHGHIQYVSRLVLEWFWASDGTIHGDRDWSPDLAKRIIDGLAQADDIELATHTLWAVSTGMNRNVWLSEREPRFDEMVFEGLFAPLVWRLPAEASVRALQETGKRAPDREHPSGLLAIDLLARSLLGLRYDPDQSFRLATRDLVNRVARDDLERDRVLLERLTGGFEFREITFEISSALPPVAQGIRARQPDEGSASSSALTTLQHPYSQQTAYWQPADLSDLKGLISEQIGSDGLVTTGLLGNYEPGTGRVTLYSNAISLCAERLGLKPRHVGSVTLIHETLHALAHVGTDLDGRMWPEFALPDPRSSLFEPSPFHEATTQYFTYRHLLSLEDPDLLHAFEAMSGKQAPPYRAWRRLQNIPTEDVRNWFMSVRRGTGSPAAPWQALLNVHDDA